MKTVISRTVTLKDLIAEPEELRMLIVHTPYALDLSHIVLCRRLVKLDLSDNKLRTLPVLGSLVNLRILHLHHNFLPHQQIEAQFTGKSSLEGLLLLTFWENPLHEGKLRHWLVVNFGIKIVNQVVVHWSERLPWVAPGASRPLLVEYPLCDASRFDKPSEALYEKVMKMEIARINELHDRGNPIITIQRHVRTFLLRKRLRPRKGKSMTVTKKKKILWDCFAQLKLQKINKDMNSLIEKRGKGELLLPFIEYRKFMAKTQAHKYVLHLRKKIADRRAANRGSYRIFRLLCNFAFPIRQLSRVHDFEAHPVLLITKSMLRPVQQLLQLAGRKKGIPADKLFSACRVQE